MYRRIVIGSDAIDAVTNVCIISYLRYDLLETVYYLPETEASHLLS